VLVLVQIMCACLPLSCSWLKIGAIEISSKTSALWQTHTKVMLSCSDASIISELQVWGGEVLGLEVKV
jgi:hypothetical protein